MADKDQPGRAHAMQIAGLLDGIAKSVRIAEAAVGKDAADHIEADLPLDELVAVDWWPPEPTDGAALLDRIANWFERFIRCPIPTTSNILTLWTVHTHLDHRVVHHAPLRSTR